MAKEYAVQVRECPGPDLTQREFLVDYMCSDNFLKIFCPYITLQHYLLDHPQEERDRGGNLLDKR